MGGAWGGRWALPERETGLGSASGEGQDRRLALQSRCTEVAKDGAEAVGGGAHQAPAFKTRTRAMGDDSGCSTRLLVDLRIGHWALNVSEWSGTFTEIGNGACRVCRVRRVCRRLSLRLRHAVAVVMGKLARAAVGRAWVERWALLVCESGVGSPSGEGQHRRHHNVLQAWQRNGAPGAGADTRVRGVPCARMRDWLGCQ